MIASKYISIIRLIIVMSLLAILPCCSGSSGGGGTSDDSTDPISTGEQTSAAAIISSNGGSIELEDGAKATITGNFLVNNIQVTMSKIDEDRSPSDLTTSLSSTYEVKIPAESIDAGTSSDDVTNGITFQVPVNTSLISKDMSKFKALIGEIPDDAYTVSEVVIDNGTETATLYGRYIVNDGIATVSVLKSFLLADAETGEETLSNALSSATISIKAKIINKKNYQKDFSQTIYRVNSSSDFAKIDSMQDTSGRIPVILIHGWQGLDDDESDDPHKTTWEKFISYFYSIVNMNDDLQDKFVLYSYRYDTYNYITSSGADLEETVSAFIPEDQEIIIIAHSMGGLVSHSYIQEHNGNDKVIKLITLGTPYHGSPIIQAMNGEITTNLLRGLAMASLRDSFLAMTTPGTLDLRWDNYDNNIWISKSNEYLSGLNDEINNNELYTAFSGSIKVDSKHKMYSIPYTINKVLGYGYDGNGNDGVVPVVSAFNDDHEFSEIGPMNNYDHGEMHDGVQNYDSEPLFIKIKQELLAAIPTPEETYRISGRVTSNGTGFGGVTITLSPGSGFAVTDASGYFTIYHVENGTYTLTPSLTGYSFNPSSISITVSDENLIAQDIVATLDVYPSAPYEIVAFDCHSGTIATRTINNSGQAVGDYENKVARGFLFSDGQVIDLGFAGDEYSVAFDINDHGQAVGYSGSHDYINNNGTFRAYLYSDGEIKEVNIFRGIKCTPKCINNQGQIAGTYYDNNNESHNFILSGNQLTDLGSLSPMSMNNYGQVVGRIDDTPGYPYAALYSNGTITYLPTLGGNTLPWCINDKGQVVGYSRTTTTIDHAFIYSDGIMTDIGALIDNNARSIAYCINNSGHVVGECNLRDAEYGPFLYYNGTVTFLSSLIDPNSGWLLVHATGINDLGQIVGSGYYDHKYVGFIMTPRNR